jgi:hypothetical protein
MTVAEARDEYAAAEAALAVNRERHARGLMDGPSETCKPVTGSRWCWRPRSSRSTSRSRSRVRQRLRDSVAW